MSGFLTIPMSPSVQFSLTNVYQRATSALRPSTAKIPCTDLLVIQSGNSVSFADKDPGGLVHRISFSPSVLAYLPFCGLASLCL